MIFKRRLDPERAEAVSLFRPITGVIDSAQRALLRAVPTYRDPGVPLAAALNQFEHALDRVEKMMPSWRTPATEHMWTRCAHALGESRDAATHLRESPPGAEEFEALNARLGDVLAPLEEFAETERRLLGKAV